MKKHIKKLASKTLILVTLLLIMVSCETTDVSDTVIDTNQPTLTVTSSTGNFDFNGVEGDQVITITATLNKATDKQVRIYIYQESGTTNSEDISLPATGYIDIPAYQTSASANIVIVKDDIAEEMETAVINIGDTRTTAAFYTPLQMNISIDNFVSDDLKMSFNWEKTIVFQGTDYSACAIADIDVFVAHAAGFDINDPFANLINDFTAATGNCPEEWTLTFENYPDGEYIFFTDLYDNGFFGINQFDPIPVTATFTKTGVFSQTVEQDASQVFNTDTASGSSNGFVAKVIISNGVYTIVDFSGTTIVSGRHSSDFVKTARPYINK